MFVLVPDVHQDNDDMSSEGTVYCNIFMLSIAAVECIALFSLCLL